MVTRAVIGTASGLDGSRRAPMIVVFPTASASPRVGGNITGTAAPDSILLRMTRTPEPN